MSNNPYDQYGNPNPDYVPRDPNTHVCCWEAQDGSASTLKEYGSAEKKSWKANLPTILIIVFIAFFFTGTVSFIIFGFNHEDSKMRQAREDMIYNDAYNAGYQNGYDDGYSDAFADKEREK